MGCQKLARRDHFDLSRHFWPQMTTNQFAIPFNLNGTVSAQHFSWPYPRPGRGKPKSPVIFRWAILKSESLIGRSYQNLLKYSQFVFIYGFNILFLDTRLFGISFFENNCLEWFLKGFMIWKLWIRFLIGWWVVRPSLIGVICISWWRSSIRWQAWNTAR